VVGLFLDVEKTITNVTIKDAPYEVSDCYIATQMMKYGEVIPGSVRTFVIVFSTSKKLTDLFFSVIPPDINFSFVFKSFTEIMAKVQRHLSIHFNTRFFKGITHEEILSGIEKKVELDNVGSINKGT
jgi:hypothetical protein